MAVTHLAPGKITPILYFKNKYGAIKMLPTDEECRRFKRHLNGLGYELHAAETLPEARKLQKELQQQLKNEMDMELAQDEFATHSRRQAIRERMLARAQSSATSRFEKDFIMMWLHERENRHDIFKKRFTDQVGHLDILEFDNPNKQIANRLDRIG